MVSSLNATLGSRGLPKRGRPKLFTTTSSKGAPRRITTYQGTPISPTRGVGRAAKQATSVRSALARVQKATSSPPRFSSLEPDQAAVLSTVLRQGDKAGATKRERLAAVETGLVESNLKNLTYGDADSQGWRQERTSQYGTGPTGANNVKASAARFFDEIKTEGAGAATPGLAAQGAQGSAFPERYDQMEGKAKQLLRESHQTTVKPSKKDLKTLKRAGVASKSTSKPTKQSPKRLWQGKGKAPISGDTGGITRESKALAKRIAALSGEKVDVISGARPGSTTTSGNTSDHSSGNATDIDAHSIADGGNAQTQAQGDRIAVSALVGAGMSRKEAKAKVQPGQSSMVDDSIDYTSPSGYRVQVIWKTPAYGGHENHVHVGIRGGGTPGDSSSSSISSSDISTYANATGMSVSSAKKVAKKSPGLIRNKLHRLQASLGGGTASSADAGSGLSTLRKRYGSPVV